MAASLCKCAIDIKEQLKLASFYVNAASPVGRHGMGKIFLNLQKQITWDRAALKVLKVVFEVGRSADHKVSFVFSPGVLWG